LQQNYAYAYSEKATKRDITTTNYQQLFDTANKQTYKTSVATLLLRKNTSFHYKKNTRFTKKTLDHKIKITHSEYAQKMRCSANHRHCATHCKPEIKKTGDNGLITEIHHKSYSLPERQRQSSLFFFFTRLCVLFH